MSKELIAKWRKLAFELREENVSSEAVESHIADVYDGCANDLEEAIMPAPPEPVCDVCGQPGAWPQAVGPRCAEHLVLESCSAIVSDQEELARKLARLEAILSARPVPPSDEPTEWDKGYNSAVMASAAVLDSVHELQSDALLLADMILNYGWHVPPSATEAAKRIKAY